MAEILFPVAGMAQNMRIKLYLFLPLLQAEQLVLNGFPDSSQRVQLHPAEYTACSAFNPKSLVEIVLNLNAAELAPFRCELELSDEESVEDEFGCPLAEPIYWYEIPGNVLTTLSQSRRIVEKRVDQE